MPPPMSKPEKVEAVLSVKICSGSAVVGQNSTLFTHHSAVERTYTFNHITM